MIKEHKFYKCKHCGNLVGMIENGGGTLVCCGEPMTELVANTVEASAEKHLPVIAVSGNTVTVNVGSIEHPMTEEHHINWVYLLTKCGGQRKFLPLGEKPSVVFSLTDNDEVISAFAYCNLHGLWKTEI
jgi:superoxide reductase